jgi:hypothetical protein
MSEIRARTQALVPAPPAMVYDLIADYQRSHPEMLPPRYFRNLKVEEGGVGAGTRITFEMTSFGTVRRFEMRITEPDPGRVLVETDVVSGVATSFRVDPAPGGQGSLVTISTRYRKSGVAGWVESWLAPRFLRTVFDAQLRLLAEQATRLRPGRRSSVEERD